MFHCFFTSDSLINFENIQQNETAFCRICGVVDKLHNDYAIGKDDNALLERGGCTALENWKSVSLRSIIIFMSLW